MADPYRTSAPGREPPRCAACSKPLTDGERAVVVHLSIVHPACETVHRKVLRGLIHECPACQGSGGNFLPDSASKCELCKGEGRLRNEPVPIMGIVGWKAAP